MLFPKTNEDIQNNFTLKYISDSLSDKNENARFHRFVINDVSAVAELFRSGGYSTNFYALCFNKRKDNKFYVAYTTEHYVKGYIYIISS